MKSDIKIIQLSAELVESNLQPTTEGAGLQKLDLSDSVKPSQDLLRQLAGLSRLTALYLGRRGLLPHSHQARALKGLLDKAFLLMVTLSVQKRHARLTLLNAVAWTYIHLRWVI